MVALKYKVLSLNSCPIPVDVKFGRIGLIERNPYSKTRQIYLHTN